MMLNAKIERGDTLALKDGTVVVVQRAKYEGDVLIRFDYVNHAEASPMLRTAWPSDINALLRKASKPVMPNDSNIKKDMPVTADAKPTHEALKNLAPVPKTETTTDKVSKAHQKKTAVAK